MFRVSPIGLPLVRPVLSRSEGSLLRRQGIIGDGIDELILEAYVNLVSNYEPGDKIYIFGFSRGAVAARALSGLISKAGLLKAESSHLIEQAWRYFLDEEMTVPFFPSDDNGHKNVKLNLLESGTPSLDECPLRS